MLEEIIKSLKEKGLDDAGVKAEVEKLKGECEKFLTGGEQTNEPAPTTTDSGAETEEEKRARVFGI